MTGHPSDPGRVRAWCACGAFFGTATAWYFHRDAARPGCRSIGASEWSERFGSQRAAS